MKNHTYTIFSSPHSEEFHGTLDEAKERAEELAKARGEAVSDLRWHRPVRPDCEAVEFVGLPWHRGWKTCIATGPANVGWLVEVLATPHRHYIQGE